MLSIDEISKIEDKELLLKELQERIDLRDSMGGALYWNITNDECCQVANICRAKGCDRDVINKILNVVFVYKKITLNVKKG